MGSYEEEEDDYESEEIPEDEKKFKWYKKRRNKYEE